MLEGIGIDIDIEHYPAVKACSLLSLKAVYSRSRTSAEKLAKEANVMPAYYDDSDTHHLDALLSRDDIDIVIIGLPIVSQPTVIRKALASGKAVLSEKPVAENMAAAQELIAYYEEKLISLKKPIWSVAENFRFYPTMEYAADQVRQLGRIEQFTFRMHKIVLPGDKYFETSWRKQPGYMGGFLLDGGVHFIAGLRMVLGSETKIKSVSAHTQQIQPHLPPVDTISATIQTDTGACGIFDVSFGTKHKQDWELEVICAKGRVSIVGSDVTVTNEEGKSTTRKFTYTSGRYGRSSCVRRGCAAGQSRSTCIT